MKNIVRIGLIVYLMLALNGCYNSESQEVVISTITSWMMYFAYILPIIFASMYQFNIKNSKWYFTILIAIVVHVVWAGLVLLISPFSFKELVVIFY